MSMIAVALIIGGFTIMVLLISVVMLENKWMDDSDEVAKRQLSNSERAR